MTRNIILHIGSPKCGSTYLQLVMLANRVRLSEHGIAYPHQGGRHPGNGLVALGMTQSRLDHLFQDHETLVLSHEDLFAVAGMAQALAALCAENRIRVRIVTFLRPFSEFMFGDYSQFIKQHLERYLALHQAFEGRSFQQFTVDRSRALNATGFLKSWARLFPDEPLTVASHHDIRKVLEPLLPVSDLLWQVPRDRVNPSLRMTDCDAIADAINRQLIAPDRIRAMLRQALRRTGGPDPGRTPERIAWIEAIFARQTDNLRESFGFENRILQAV